MMIFQRSRPPFLVSFRSSSGSLYGAGISATLALMSVLAIISSERTVALTPAESVSKHRIKFSVKRLS